MTDSRPDFEKIARDFVDGLSHGGGTFIAALVEAFERMYDLGQQHSARVPVAEEVAEAVKVLRGLGPREVLPSIHKAADLIERLAAPAPSVPEGLRLNVTLDGAPGEIGVNYWTVEGKLLLSATAEETYIGCMHWLTTRRKATAAMLAAAPHPTAKVEQ